MFLGYRYIVTSLICIGMVIVFGLKISFNALMNNIVYHTYVRLVNGTSAGFCYQPSAKHLERNVTSIFDMSVDLQKWLMDSYNYGYIFGNFPGAYMAEFMSAKWTWFASIVINIICCFGFTFVPTSLFWPHLSIRTIQGFASGFIYPATSILLAEWAPDSQKNTIGGIAFVGTMLGSVLGRVVSTFLMTMFTWDYTYYIMTGCSCLWLILWGGLVYDKPSESPFIKEKERDYILLSNIDIIKRKTPISVDWSKVFTNKPFWALFVMHSSCGTVFTIVMKDMVIYMWDVLFMNMQQIIIFTNLAYCIQCVCTIFLGITLDSLVRRKKITQCWAKKISTLLISAPSFICIMSLSYIKCSLVVAVMLIMIIMICFCGMNTGYLINHVDIGPKIAGRLMAITNTGASLGAIIAPLIMDRVLDEKLRNIVTWRVVFWTCGGFFIVDMMCYTIWGDAANQDFYREQDDED
nr:sialin-like [Onthophagus taurus]